MENVCAIENYRAHENSSFFASRQLYIILDIVVNWLEIQKGQNSWIDTMAM